MIIKDENVINPKFKKQRKLININVENGLNGVKKAPKKRRVKKEELKNKQ